MEANAWEYELSLFTEDLIASLLCRHPELHKLSCKRSGSLHFTEEISKCVLLTWRDRKYELDQYFVRDYPSFVESKHCFKQYLKHFVEMQKKNSATSQILGLSTILLGILFFLHRKRVTHFVRDASSYLFFMLSTVKAEEFHEEGGWSHLASISATLSEDYDEETCRQYISGNIYCLSASDATENTNIDSTLECPIETLPEETSEKHGQDVVSVEKKSENVSEKDSTNEEITSDEIKIKYSPKVVLILNKPEDETEEVSNKKIDPNEVTISQVVSILNKPENETEKDSTNKEVGPKKVTHKIFNKPEDKTEKDSAKKGDPNEATISKDVLSDLNKSEDILKKVSTNEEAALDKVKEKYSQGDPIMNKLQNEPEENSTNKEIIIKEATDKNSQEVVSAPNKSENGSEKDLTNEKITPGEVEEKHSQKVASILNQLKDEIQNDSTNNEIDSNEVTDTISQEIASVVNKSEDKSEKDSINELVNKSSYKDEIEKDSTNNEVDSNEVTDTISQIVSIVNKSEDKPEKDSINEEFALNEVKEHSRVPNFNKLEDEPEINSPDKEVTPNEMKDLFHDIIVSCESEDNPRNNSTKLNSNLSEATYEIKNASLKHPNVLREDSPTTLSSDLTSSESKELTVEYVKPNECLKVSKQSMSQNSVHQDVLESPLVPEKIQSTDSSHHLSLNLTIPPKDFDSLKAEENFPEEESKISRDSNKSAGECSTHRTIDFTEPTDCLIEVRETNPTDCDLAKELDKFLTDEILSHFQVRFLTKDEIESVDAIKFFPVDNVGNDCNIYTFKRDGTVETDLTCSNNIPTLENLPKTVVISTEKESSSKPVCTNDNATKKDSSLFKSPKHEMNKKAVPNKTKTPSSEKWGVKNTKSKTASSNIDSETPVRIRTPISSTSTEKNTIEAKIAKKLNYSPALKSSSPCFKAPTEKGVPKTQLKSSEKTEQSRNFPLSKASTEITKSSSEPTTAANSKSRKGELSDSSKPLPSIMQTKLGEKDPLNSFKSSRNTSESISKRKVNTVDVPTACEKRKPTNPKTENCQKSVSREKTAGSSSAKSIDQSESKTSKSSEEYLDKKSCKDESSAHVTKCDQNKVHEPSTARRTRNVHGKNIPTDSKNEKPRWR